MKKLILTVLILGLSGTVGPDTIPDVIAFGNFHSDSEPFTYVDGHLYKLWCDSCGWAWMTDDSSDQGYYITCWYELVPEEDIQPCCTVFVDKPCTVWTIPTDHVVRIPLWMQYKWQQIEAIVDSVLAEI